MVRIKFLVLDVPRLQQEESNPAATTESAVLLGNLMRLILGLLNLLDVIFSKLPFKKIFKKDILLLFQIRTFINLFGDLSNVLLE